MIRWCMRSLALAASLALGCTATGMAEFIEEFAKTFGDVVPAPAQDSTPPSVSLHVPDFGHGKGDMVLHSGGPGAVIHVGGIESNGFFVIAAAEDAEGIQSVCVGRQRVKVCTPAGGLKGLPKLFNPPAVCDSTSAAVGEDVTTRRWIPLWVDLSELTPCPKNTTGTHTLKVWAIGENFGGQTVASAELQLVQP